MVGADLFRQTDPAPVANRLVANPREVAAYTYGYNHSLFAQRVHDVLTLVSYLQHGDMEGRPRPKRILLAACGDVGPVAAATLAVGGDAVARAAIDTGGFRFANLTDWRDAMFLPGSAKYLDLPGMLKKGSTSAPRFRGTNAGSGSSQGGTTRRRRLTRRVW